MLPPSRAWNGATFAPPWPPDLSQLIPDLFVALVTGAAVGLFVIIAERIISARTTARANTAQQRKAVAAAEGAMAAPIQFEAASLLPVDSALKRVRQKVRETPLAPTSERVADFLILRQYIERWEEMRFNAERLESELARVLQTNIGAAAITKAFKSYLNGVFRGSESRLWDEFWDDAWIEPLGDDARLREAAVHYIIQRGEMVGWQGAYLARRDARAKAYVSWDSADPPAHMSMRRRRRIIRRDYEQRELAAEQAGETAGVRVIRTIGAKALHKVDAVFGRFAYKDLVLGDAPPADTD